MTKTFVLAKYNFTRERKKRDRITTEQTWWGGIVDSISVKRCLKVFKMKDIHMLLRTHAYNFYIILYKLPLLELF